jgi:hypothetical protein
LKLLNNRENKGELDDFNRLRQLNNRAMRAAMAQLKMKWRRFGGANCLVENLSLAPRFNAVEDDWEGKKTV